MDEKYVLFEINAEILSQVLYTLFCTGNFKYLPLKILRLDDKNGQKEYKFRIRDLDETKSSLCDYTNQ